MILLIMTVMKNVIVIVQLMFIGGLGYVVHTYEPNSDEPFKIIKNQVASVFHPSPPMQNEDDKLDDKLSEKDKKELKEFLIDMNDARMMDLEEGKLAANLGTTPIIRGYGKWMIEDQSKLKAQLEVLAQKKSIKLPTTLSEKKAKGLAQLQEEEGKDFDKKFLHMMKIDHRRDVRKFKQASRKIDDKDLQDFTTRNQPIIEEHLDSLKAID